MFIRLSSVWQDLPAVEVVYNIFECKFFIPLFLNNALQNVTLMIVRPVADRACITGGTPSEFSLHLAIFGLT